VQHWQLPMLSDSIKLRPRKQSPGDGRLFAFIFVKSKKLARLFGFREYANSEDIRGTRMQYRRAVND
jgi:hypothetical protein